MNVLAIDVGPSAVRAAVVTDSALGPVARTAYAVDRPTAEAVEVPPRRLWDAIAAASREAARAVDSVAGVGMSCMAPGLVLLDQADQPLAPIWTSDDRRARTAARQIWNTVGPEFLQSTGNRPLPGGISAVCWKHQHTEDPYLTHRVKHYLHLNGWLGLHMTGQRAFDPNNASLTGLFGTTTDQSWSPRWCEYFQIDPAWLPPVYCGSSTLGSLRSQAAADLGVPSGIPVKLGTTDIGSALLGGGLHEGDLLQIVYASQLLAAPTSRPAPHSRRLTCRNGAGEGFIHVTHNPMGVPALDWLHRLCFADQDANTFHGKTIPEAARLTTRVTLDPAYLDGERLEIEAHRAAFRDLTLTTERLELLAALLEALRRGQRAAIVDLDCGERFTRIFLTGAGAKRMQDLLPSETETALLDNPALHGAARLFQK